MRWESRFRQRNRIRIMMQATLHVHDHRVHFIICTRWTADVVAALKADLASDPPSRKAFPHGRYPRRIFPAICKRLKRFIESGQSLSVRLLGTSGDEISAESQFAGGRPLS